MTLFASRVCIASLGLGAVLASACSQPIHLGTFGTTSFDLVRDHYRITYDSDRRVMNRDWLVENFQITERGDIGPAKWTPAYLRSVSPDMNDDGRPERPVALPRFDLHMTHSRDGTSLWTQTTPVSGAVGMRDLEVIAHDFVDRVGGGSYIEIDWGADAIRERHVGTIIREEGPVRVDEVDAYWVTFDMVSVDQREVNADHQGERVTVVVMRPDSRWTREERFSQADGLPMLVMAGYASRAEHHAAHREEFEGLLRRIDFHNVD
jgi:hypothetical protein